MYSIENGNSSSPSRMTNFVLWVYVFNLIICALKGYVSFTFLNDTSSHFRIMCDSAGLLDLLTRFGAQVKIHWRYISTPCIYCSRTYTGYRLVVCVRQVFHLLFSALTTKLILAASFGVDSSAMRPCQTNAYSLGILKSGFAWSGQMFVSKSFSLNVKSIVLNNVWNAKLNLFIYLCVSLGWDGCPEGRNLLSTPPLYVSANTDASVWTGLVVKYNLQPEYYANQRLL